MAKNNISRRQFLGRSLAASAAFGTFTIVPRHVLGGKGYIPPSEQLTKAVIGVGSMGRGHITNVNPAVRCIAVCDVDKDHLKRALEIAPKGTKAFTDFRDVIALPEVDIVHIATPPHWHGIMSVEAANAGKDIWCEKPMTRTIGEGKKVIEAVRRNGRIFRLNTWFRFRANFYGMNTTVRPIKKAVMNGLLGWPIKCTISKTTGFDWKFYWCGKTDLEPQKVPANLDYDMWLGPAPYKPYNAQRVHSKFRGYWDYDGGGLGDMGQHYIDPVQYILGKDNTSPVEIIADCPQQHSDAVDAGGPWRRITYRYADGCEIILDGANSDKDAAFLEGPKGKIYNGFKSDIPNLDKKLMELPDPDIQIVDFVQAVSQRKEFALNDMNGHRSCTLVNLGKIAMRLRRKLNFDPVNQVFIGDDQANRYIDQPMRGPWYI